MKFNARLFRVEEAADSDDWYTPPWVFEGLGLTFDLDVASPPGGLPWIPAKQVYDESDNGLAQPWFGLVWCNPPYSAPYQWCIRYAAHADGLILLRADLSTRGPFIAFTASDAMWVPQKRLAFVNGHGGNESSVAFSTVLLGRGLLAQEGMERLATTKGGTFRRLI